MTLCRLSCCSNGTNFCRITQASVNSASPRWLNTSDKLSWELHGFCDASQKAYGAALYVRVRYDDQVRVHLLTAKTRVAPVKTVSLTRWSTFVANRVSSISKSASGQSWSHVRSEDNPADLASHGVSASELSASSLWWHGPDWLQRAPQYWPTLHHELPDTQLEQRVQCHTTATTLLDDVSERFSHYGRALRELLSAERALIRTSQRREYIAEIRALGEGRPLPSSSTLLNMNPFLDQHKVLRSCGRLRAAESLRYDERHPILLPYSTHFTRLLVEFAHRITLHGGNQLMVRYLRTKFWIPRIKNLVKSYIKGCKVCIVHRRRLQTQMMGDIPRERITYSRPFTHTGIDFAGPFEIKNYTGLACLITKGLRLCVFQHEGDPS
ncbi:uncharacterized protein [Drosophila tropicalis]|uniref:uncharacterized protein n=1 Tax=Drosophila tropicalis TaxID=46794 RepID=UPI0035AC0BAC